MNLTICVLTFMIMAANGLAQTRPSIDALYDRLVQPSETNAAAPEIVKMASNDSGALNYLAGKLPMLISSNRPTSDPVWANAVRLAGQLKIVAAVPALGQALSRPAVLGGYDSEATGAYTFTIGARLVYDVVGRALADIGDPSIPVVANLLSSGDIAARRRAFWILVNIDSPAALQAMRDHLPRESDSTIKDAIQHHLGSKVNRPAPGTNP